MNLYDASRPEHRVGLIELPELSDLLHDCGVTVVDGENYREAVTAISGEFSTGRFPILCADTETPGLAKWIVSSASKKVVVGIVREDPAVERIDSPEVISIPIPFTVNELLALIGLPPLGTDSGNFEYPEPPQDEDHGLPDLDSLDELDVLPPDEDPWNTPSPHVVAPVATQTPVIDHIEEPEPYSPLVQASTPRPVAEAFPAYVAPAPVAEPQHEDRLPVETPVRARQEPAMAAASSGYAGAFVRPSHGAPGSSAPRRRNDCPVIFSCAAKGGVGKTTTSIQLANIAASAGLKVILIDGNVGQGDIAKFLKINHAHQRTIVNALGGDMQASIMSPEEVNDARPRELEHVDFGLVLAPAPSDDSASHVTPATYRDMVDYCRQQVDLVICDTQILETVDRTGMFDLFVLPFLTKDGWAVTLTDQSNAGLLNLIERLTSWQYEGVSPQHVFTYANKIKPAAVEFALASIPPRFNDLSRFAGVVELDERVADGMNMGRTQLGHESMSTLLRMLLLHATGDRRLEEAEPVRQKQGFLARLLGGGKRK